jgi:hypothetical protein
VDWYEFTNVSEICTDDGGKTDLRHVVKLIPVYMVLQPRRQPSSAVGDVIMS